MKKKLISSGSMHVTAPTENRDDYHDNPSDSNQDYDYQDYDYQDYDYQDGDWKDDGCSNVEDDNNNYNLHEYDLNGYNDDNEDAAAKDSRKLLISSIKHGSTRALYDDFVSIVNDYNYGINEPLFSHFRSTSLLKKTYPIVSIRYDICPNGCKMYQPDEDAHICAHCGQPRYNNKKRNNDGTPRNKQARATVQQFFLIEQLALFIQDNETHSLLLHRSERHASEKDVYRDIYDGKNYKKLEKDGLFSGNLDIAISIYTDGFTALDNYSYH